MHAHTLKSVLRACLFVQPPPIPPVGRRPTPTAPNRAPALMVPSLACWRRLPPASTHKSWLAHLSHFLWQALRELLGSDMGVRFHQASDGSGIGAALAAAY